MHFLVLLVAVFGLSETFAAPPCIEAVETDGSIHAVIVAGTNTSAGLAYALQGAAYEAYHMLTDRGVPRENIVLMSWDDAVNDSGNPIPGKIYSTPEKTRDVREGVQIDYSGADVNPKNILAVLSGSKSAVNGGNGRVLESSSKDKVFVFFAAHGHVGVWHVGDQAAVPITAHELQMTLKEMHANGKYEELVFTMEASHSGSMFDALPKDINVYAITSSKAHEISKCIYCPGWDVCLHDEDNWVCNLNGCVSGLFRNKVFTNIESNQEGETLEKHYESVKSEVTEFCTKHWASNCRNETQTVSHFGDFAIAKGPVTNFAGKPSLCSSPLVAENERPYAVWTFEEAEMRQLEHRFAMAMVRKDYKEADRMQEAIDDLMKKYAKVDTFLAGFDAPFVAGEGHTFDYVRAAVPERLTELECHDAAVRAFHAKCMPQISGTAYAGKYASVMAALCESSVPVEGILARIDEYC